jgi:hypothetical protein
MSEEILADKLREVRHKNLLERWTSGAPFVTHFTRPAPGRSRCPMLEMRRRSLCLKVHQKSKVRSIQTENGLFRLSKEFGELNCGALEHYVRVCPPPPYGLCFQTVPQRTAKISTPEH